MPSEWLFSKANGVPSEWLFSKANGVPSEWLLSKANGVPSEWLVPKANGIVVLGVDIDPACKEIVARGSALVKFAPILVIDLYPSSFHRAKPGFGNPW